ncbi:hypothetical protein [Heyndrickxia sporothermodurans]|uniref:hypothetical protein n=1 Tax=Heyndrickxia sporothermodurans TaxID=46224 RepID=UPI00192BA6AD|nr:hypothetical protein [Heyndrickxia sporothermodurans]MBL5864871.1 hypothetical protein [Heyndrickxia sporothermodurans]
MKNRYLLCILLTALMLYYALPHLAFSVQHEAGIFSIAWLGLALLVFAGNLTAWLFAPKKQRANKNVDKPLPKRVKSHN